MKIYLAHARFIRKWESDWVYVGRNFIRMTSWEKSCLRERISLTEQVEKAKEELLHDYLSWLEKQRIANKDSLSWWMSFLAGRNNLVSFFFLHVCQITAVKELLAQNRYDKVLIVCEDAFVLSAMQANLKDKNPACLAFHKLRGFCLDILLPILKICAKIPREFFRALRHRRLARKTLPQVTNSPKNPKVYLIFQCLDDKPFLRESGRLEDRYLTSLPTWLESKGYNVVTLPWLFKTDLPLEQIYRRLRSDFALILWDYIGIPDLIKAFYDHFKAVFFIDRSIQWDNLHLRALCNKESLVQLGSLANIEFRLHVPLIDRWSKAYENVIGVSTFERNQLEMGLAAAFAKDKEKYYYVGYYHSLTTKEYFSYHSIASEWESDFVPDLIVTNGTLSKDILIKQGAPTGRIIAGPALRQKKEAAQQKNIHECKDILILLSLDLMASYEILSAFHSIHNWIQNELKVNVRLKLHPMGSKGEILRILKIETLPDNWIWESGEIYEALKNVYCASAMTTASVYDAVLSGCIVIPLRKELDFMGNYLDIFADGNKYLKAVTADFLQNRLEEIYLTNKSNFSSEFAKIREQLQNGLGDITDENYAKFLARSA